MRRPRAGWMFPAQLIQSVMPTVAGYFPVSTLARVGEHTGQDA